MIWGSQGGDAAVLPTSAVIWTGKLIPTFRRNSLKRRHLPTNTRRVTAQKNNIAYLIQAYLNKIEMHYYH